MLVLALSVFCLPWIAKPVFMQSPAAVVSVSAASFNVTVTPDGIAAAFGLNLATGTAQANTRPLPTVLNNVRVQVAGRDAGLYFVSPGQINYLVPPETPVGQAQVVVRLNNSITHQGTLTVANTAPAIFTANANGQGVPAAVALRQPASGPQTFEAVVLRENNVYVPRALSLGPANERLFLVLYLSGVRRLPNSDNNAANGVAENVRALLGGGEYGPSFAGPAPDFIGLDQVNLELPRALIGRGRLTLNLTAAGVASNPVEIDIAGERGPQPPQITNYAPATVTAGETITLSGANFANTTAGNLIILGGVETRVIESATTGQITARLPFGISSGRIRVRTQNGEGESTASVPVRTTVSGIVTDTNGAPLPGVEVSMDSVKITTGADGRYTLRDVSPGALKVLRVNATKLPVTPPLSRFDQLINVIANRDNNQRDIRLQPASGPGVAVQDGGSAASDTTAETEAEPDTPSLIAATLAPEDIVIVGGVRFELPNNAVALFPADQRGNRVYLTRINQSRTPVKLPDGVFSSAIVQLTPFGVQLTPGGKLTFPNADGLPANAQVPLYKLNQTASNNRLGQFIVAGTATVSADGQRVETAANAITETSIYFVALPRPNTTALTGRVLDSDNTTPVRNALVSCLGQEAYTDGNGGFTLRNIPLPANNQLTVEASYVRPTGRIDRVVRFGIVAVANGITRVTPNLVLPAVATNRPPTLFVPDAVTITQNQIRNFNFIASDPDTGQTLTTTVTGAAFASIVQTSTGPALRLAPGTVTPGNYTLTLRTADNQNGVATATVIATVIGNRPPVLFVPGAQTIAVGQTLSFTVFALDPDDAQTLTLRAPLLPAGATFNQTSTTTGRFTWTPTATGNFTANFTASDGSLSDTKTVAITVIGGDPPLPPPWVLTSDFGAGEIRNIVAIGNDLYHSRFFYGVFRSPDNGSGWVPFNQGFPGGGTTVIALDARNGYLFAGANNLNSIYRTLPGTSNWTPTQTGVDTLYQFTQSGTAIYAAAFSGFYSSTNDGASWTKVGNLNMTAASIGSNGFYAISYFGGDVYRSIDAGGFWSKIGIPALDTANDAATTVVARGTELFVGTTFSGIYYSSDIGITWQPLNTGIATLPNSTRRPGVERIYLHNNVLYACLGKDGATGGIVRFNNATRTWQTFNEGLTDLRVASMAFNNDFFYAGTTTGKFYRRPTR
jgi:uncharacterized protein (TIGR03437 family)